MDRTNGSKPFYRRAGWPFFGVLALAVLLRWWKFEGLFGADDLSYSKFAFEIVRGVYRPEYLNHWSMRLGVLLPTAFFYSLFGVSQWSMVAFSLICSLMMVVLTYLIGRRFFGEEIGLLAAFLLATFPLNVLYATRLFPDIPMALFVGLSGYFYLSARRKESSREVAKSMLASGSCLGVAYLMKETALLFILPVALCGLIDLRRGFRRFVLVHFCLFLGVAAFVVLEGLFYHGQVHDFLFRFREFLPSASSAVPMAGSPGSPAASARPAPLLEGAVAIAQRGAAILSEYARQFAQRFLYMMSFPRRLFEFREYDIPLFIKMMLPYYCGIHYVAVYLSVILLIGWHWGKIREDGNLRFVLVWWLSLFLYINFGSSSILSYRGQAPNPRYLHFVEIPAFLVLSVTLREMSKRWGSRVWKGTLCFLLFGGIASLWLKDQIPLSYRPELTIRLERRLARLPRKTIYTDGTTKRSLEFLWGYGERTRDLISFDTENRDFLPDSYVILHWWNLNLGQSHKGMTIPESFKDPPANWEVVGRIRGPDFRYFTYLLERIQKIYPGFLMRKNPQRKDVVIYHVAD